MIIFSCHQWNSEVLMIQILSCCESRKKFDKEQRESWRNKENDLRETYEKGQESYNNFELTSVES